jgi:hypothetical protein
MNLVVKVSQLFPAFERSGEWYNTVGMLIMSCLETLLKNLKTASVSAAIPVVSSLSDSVLSVLQASPLQDGTTKFWHESLHRVWRVYFTFIETYLPQKSVKDFLGWMSALLEIGFRHPLQEIQNVTVTFWDNVVVPAFARDNTNVPRVLKEAREKCRQMSDTSCIVPHSATSQLGAKVEPLQSVPFALPEETNKVCIMKLKQAACHMSAHENISVRGLSTLITGKLGLQFRNPLLFKRDLEQNAF